MRSTVATALRADLPPLDRATITTVTVGRRWLMVDVRTTDGRHRAGLANRCGRIAGETLEPSPYPVAKAIADLDAQDPLRRTIAVATVNALLAPDPDHLAAVDGADWLAETAGGRRVAVVGRFPFLEAEIRPVADTLWIFERDPATGEHGSDAMRDLLPQAEVVAITASTVVNATLDDILPHVTPDATTMLLGPSTPLAPGLLDLGFDALSGVRVIDADRARADVAAGNRFRQIHGLRRVTLLAPPTTPDSTSHLPKPTSSPGGDGWRSRRGEDLSEPKASSAAPPPDGAAGRTRHGP